MVYVVVEDEVGVGQSPWSRGHGDRYKRRVKGAKGAGKGGKGGPKGGKGPPSDPLLECAAGEEDAWAAALAGAGDGDYVGDEWIFDSTIARLAGPVSLTHLTLPPNERVPVQGRVHTAS